MTSPPKVCWMRLACGSPWETQPGQSIWNASITTTSPLSPARVGLSAVLNQRVMASSGAAGYVDCVVNGGNLHYSRVEDRSRRRLIGANLVDANPQAGNAVSLPSPVSKLRSAS